MILGNKNFNSKTEIEKRCQYLLRRYKNKEIPQSEFGFLLDVLSMHPDSQTKKSGGVKRFIVKDTKAAGKNYRGYPCFYIVHDNNTIQEFSYKKCLMPNKLSLLNKRTLMSYRTAIDPYIMAFKNQNANQKCKLCGGLASTCDHEYEFNRLVIDFEKQLLNKNIPDQFDFDPLTHQTRFKNSDSSFVDEWIDYHNKHAKLRMLCMSCNLRRSRPPIYERAKPNP